MNAFVNTNTLSSYHCQDKAAIDERFKNRFNSLGISVDNLSREEAIDAIFNLIDAYAIDHKPKLVATLNVDFLVNSLGYSFDRPRHPELLNVLRSADLVTADGFPIVLLSKIAGFPLKQRVTGADLTPALAAVAAKKGKSIYLLGGGGNTAKQAAALLVENNPDLKIAGTSAPMVAIDGEKMAAWEEDDRAVVEEINASGADILFMAFGNPKQELWWSRNKHRLNIPVSIGVGGTFAFITGQVKRAPVWMQKHNLEWLFRISQDPQRLFKRYAIGLVKFGFLTLPLITQRLKRNLSRHLGWIKSGANAPCEFDWKLHWAARDDVLKTLRLPKVVSREYLESLVSEIQTSSASGRDIYHYMIDFSRVRQLSLAANEAFCELSRLFASGRANGLMIGMSDSLRKRLERARVMDIASSSSISIEQMQDSIMLKDCPGSKSEFKTYAVGDTCLNYFRGDVTGQQLAVKGFEACMFDSGKHRKTIIDMRRVSSIDSAAIAVLYRLAIAAERKQIHEVRFSGMTSVIRQMISVLDMAKAFKCIGDKEFYDQLFGAGQ